VLFSAPALEPFAFEVPAGAFAEAALALAVPFLPEDFAGEPEPDSSFPRGFLPAGPG
jgi:hypothetical protein